MGARVCAQSLQQKKISLREASWLLAFINNIGPVYFSGYVLTLFPVRTPLTVWLGMYLLPFLYGMVLRYTLYRDLPTQSVSRVFVPASVRCQANTPASPTGTFLSSARLLSALHESILSAMNGIAQLGGYMVFFQPLKSVPDSLFGSLSGIYTHAVPTARDHQRAVYASAIGAALGVYRAAVWRAVLHRADCKLHSQNRAVAETVHLS